MYYVYKRKVNSIIYTLCNIYIIIGCRYQDMCAKIVNTFYFFRELQHAHKVYENQRRDPYVEKIEKNGYLKRAALKNIDWR